MVVHWWLLLVYIGIGRSWLIQPEQTTNFKGHSGWQSNNHALIGDTKWFAGAKTNKTITEKLAPNICSWNQPTRPRLYNSWSVSCGCIQHNYFWLYNEQQPQLLTNDFAGSNPRDMRPDIYILLASIWYYDWQVFWLQLAYVSAVYVPYVSTYWRSIWHSTWHPVSHSGIPFGILD